MSTIDEYLATLEQPQRLTLRRVLEVATRTVPGLEQGTSYGMAALLLQARPVLGFRAATAHLSVFPFSPAVVEAVADRLAGFHLSKGTVRFTSENPLPADVIEEMVRLRVAEITGAAGT